MSAVPGIHDKVLCMRKDKTNCEVCDGNDSSVWQSLWEDPQLWEAQLPGSLSWRAVWPLLHNYYPGTEYDWDGVIKISLFVASVSHLCLWYIFHSWIWTLTECVFLMQPLDTILYDFILTKFVYPVGKKIPPSNFYLLFWTLSLISWSSHCHFDVCHIWIVNILSHCNTAPLARQLNPEKPSAVFLQLYYILDWRILS